MSIKTSQYQLFKRVIASWKPRAKAIKVNLKDIAKDAGIKPQHLTKIITGKFVTNPRVKTIDAVEAALFAAEEKAAETVKKAGV